MIIITFWVIITQFWVEHYENAMMKQKGEMKFCRNTG